MPKFSKGKCRYCSRVLTGEDRVCPQCREKLQDREAERERVLIAGGGNLELYRARRDSGLTAKQIAKLAHVSDSTLNKCESGELDLLPETRERVARVLKRPVEELFPEPYRVRCRHCLGRFEPEGSEKICPDCREDAKRRAREAVKPTPGSNQRKIATIARMARKKGMTYGQYVGAEYAERMESHG